MEKFNYEKENLILQETLQQFEKELENLGIKTKIFATFTEDKMGQPRIKFVSEPFDLNLMPVLKLFCKSMKLVSDVRVYNEEKHLFSGRLFLEIEFLRYMGSEYEGIALKKDDRFLYWEYDLEKNLWRVYTR